MCLWQLYYHIVWGTKQHLPLIVPQQEFILHNYIIRKANEVNCIIHGIGGMEDHIHLVISIPPTIAIANLIENIKYSSSCHFYENNFFTPTKFFWDSGYSVCSLSYKQLEQTVSYVKNQKKHHLQGTVKVELEKTNIN
ncbi:IS200/IS605 family transposase [Umezakia ovalisporum]|uniref:IS200/IS605 family transposase n=2 Tax=Umezakia ovalisporum TaxID=75695 RepID=A0AA43GYF7_9CYAN|nr:IS200/IS605 family transposase [Umezakia ovalisporum]MDH6058234.1 IS200/IS605 family transposase [Umezakia ovalisporum FSS-43]MDH6063805.1 IS200/IS605 family transposase [Umezakia ovalisporum FSS-62]MDH6066976.1 IS200/IS605 family transposase [Umezakia ovalisporum APH033B]MDH6072347.1 IS200/IS605 family transposase [Umezakia ovalisporum CobakiLakeA]MDH6076245.1 IS200/IS605 family transposase [Umezakia ovalisporum CS-1034]